MPNKISDNDSVYNELNTSQYNKKIQSVPTPPKEIGIDTEENFFNDIIASSISSTLDVSAFTNFDQASRSRDQMYNLIDDMCEDPLISSVMEAYAEDATEKNELGKIVWADSSDADIGKYINYLLDSMRVDKNIYKWVYSLCKYGDIYLRLYRESEYNDGLFEKPDKNKTKSLNEHLSFEDIQDPDLNEDKEHLNENVNIKAYSKNDKLIQYLEMQDNPAQVFELTKFGKTYAYIKTNVVATNMNQNDYGTSSLFGYKYKFNSSDIDIYPATEFVHGSVESGISRSPEEVTISMSGDKELSYKVKRGQPLLYDAFKAWRELTLLENSVLLNRVTRSSLVRAIQVEIGDMPKEQVQPHLQGIKRLFEQSQAIVAGKSMKEYTNPGPSENNVYIPTRDGKGAISLQQIGGEVNVGQLNDLNYFRDKLFSGLKVPKQFFGFTEDGAGFNGGESLAQISSQYAKAIKAIQNIMVQTLTDAINLFLLDNGLNNYINKFKLKMQPPVTQDEIAKRENTAAKVDLTNNIMNMLTDVEDVTVKLRILKAMLTEYINNTEVIDILQSEIDRLENAAKEEEMPPEEEDFEGNSEDTSYIEPEEDFSTESEDINELGDESSLEESPETTSEELPDYNIEEPTEDNTEYVEEEQTTLPAPNELNIDFTDEI